MRFQRIIVVLCCVVVVFKRWERIRGRDCACLRSNGKIFYGSIKSNLLRLARKKKLVHPRILNPATTT